MKRVYTDERFPGCEIVNDGSLTFEVYCKGELLQSFESWERTAAAATVSEPFAARRAAEYFDRWARMDLSTEIGAQQVAQSPAATAAAPDNVTRTIDDLMAQERLEADPQRKRAIQLRIMQLMQQEESVAAAVVNYLIR